MSLAATGPLVEAGVWIARPECAAPPVDSAHGALSFAEGRRPPRVSVQICTHNRQASLARCLASLFQVEFAPDDFEIVLVDDGSTDWTAQMVEALSPPCAFRYVRQAHAGLASARNAGIRAAAGEVVLFLDDDVIAAPSLLEGHWRAHHRRGGASVVIGVVRHIATPEIPPRIRPRLADFSTSFFWTCNASVRRADLLAAGLFDEAFTEYGWEDLELGDRLRHVPLRRKRSRAALVYHVKPPWRGSDLPRLVAQAEASGRSAVVYVRKAQSWRARLATGLSPARVRANLCAARWEPMWWRLARRAGDGELTGVARSAAWLLLRAHYYRSAMAASSAAPGGL
jgi:glycosyltransferase involved in cell wall biosynthesis